MLAIPMTAINCGGKTTSGVEPNIFGCAAMMACIRPAAPGLSQLTPAFTRANRK
jgi:hypothetical protein